MPVCTHCSLPVPSLWTVYSSVSNIRLTICEACSNFADPYVEQPPLLLFLDLVLLKPGVYRHLLFNRGKEPVQAGRFVVEEKRGEPESRAEETSTVDGRRKMVVNLLVTLSLSTIVADTYLRWLPLHSASSAPSPSEEMQTFLRLLGITVLETVVFHFTVLLVGLGLLKLRALLRPHLSPSAPRPRSSRETRPPLPDDFHPFLIPLALLLSSLPKLLLLLLLSIWSTPPTAAASPPSSFTNSLHAFLSYASLERLGPLLTPLAQVLAQEPLDRSWLTSNVLGGIGVGFGLRVLLMGRLSALETTALVCVAWWARWKVMERVGEERRGA